MFPAISAKADEITEMESLCVRCMKNGTTRLLPAKIPHFKQIIVSSFDCNECGFSNREIMPAAEIAERGVRYDLKVESKVDLDREVIRSLTARITLPSLEFSFEPGQSCLSTVEGFLTRAIDNLEHTQENLRKDDPENAVKLAIFLSKLKKLVIFEDGPFQLEMDDPTGNSFITSPENIAPGQVDKNLTVSHYVRSVEQNKAIGIGIGEPPAAEAKKPDLVQFAAVCPKCEKPNCEANMQQVDVPNFGEVVVMASCCPDCGYREAEARPGGGVAPLARKISLKVESMEDLKRMVVKSSTAGIEVPDIELELTPGTLGGRITTVEGLLRCVYDDLQGAMASDSLTAERKEKINEFMQKLDELASGRRFGFHVIIDDPAGKVFIESYSDVENDINLEIKDYERTFEQNDELGLNDMKVEGYEEEHAKGIGQNTADIKMDTIEENE